MARLTPAVVRGTLGALWSGVAAVLLVTSWSPVIAGHPAYGVSLALAALVGVVLLVRAVLAHRSGVTVPWSRRRAIGAVSLIVVTALTLGSLTWLRPFSASPVAVTSMAGTVGVRVTDGPTTITLTPVQSPRAGLVFQPGARVDPRAYVPILSKVAEQGYLVVVVKQPFDIGFLAIDAPTGVLSAHPQVTRWAVGGHSLGGVAAASYAAGHPEVAGLVLWASYPASSMADDTRLRIVSVSGSNDGLATPAKMAANKALLPTDTTYVAVDGAIHAYFGDYGTQPGDGTAAIGRDEAQTQITAATVALLAAL